MSKTSNGKQKYSLIWELLLNPQRYEFYMAVKLLRAFWGDSLRITTKPNLTLGFNANDIAGIEAYDLTRPEISFDRRINGYRKLTPQMLMDAYADAVSPPVEFVFYVNFLGLFGSSSPLPIYYTEEVMQDEGDDNPCTADFLSLINAPVYRAYERAKNKYRIFNLMVEKSPGELLDRIFTFAGLSLSDIRSKNLNVYELLPYLGLFSMIPRSSMGLLTIFQGELKDCKISIEDFGVSVSEIPKDQLIKLGVENSVLGEDAYVGTLIRSVDNEIRVTIGCSTREQFDELMPNGSIYARLGRIMTAYMIDRIRIIMHVTIRDQIGREYRLGDRSRGLGINTFMGNDSNQLMEFTMPLNY